MRKYFQALRVIPEIHKLIKDLAESEGRTVSKMLEILHNNFIQTKEESENGGCKVD